ncbi:MAG: ABC transporter ATP-binding protein, partial [Oscillospiraceae bacterium]|nr:ABC transporter ATP-binding protein [Oscillospiraceae bacterium]
MKKDFNRKPLALFMSYIAGHKKLFIVDMICAVIVSVIDLVFPYISRLSMQNLLPKKMFVVFFVVMAIMA